MDQELGAEEGKDEDFDDDRFEEWEEHLPGGISESNRRATEHVQDLQSALRRASTTTSKVTPKHVRLQSTPMSGKAMRRKNISSNKAGRANSPRVIHGVTIRGSARPTDEIQPTKTWNKLERANLTPEERALFVKGATGYCLTKHNKLAVHDLDPKDDKSLENIRNTKLQLDLIRAHVRNYDIGDVLNIVVPKYDVLDRPEVEDQTYSLRL